MTAWKLGMLVHWGSAGAQLSSRLGQPKRAASADCKRSSRVEEILQVQTANQEGEAASERLKALIQAKTIISSPESC